LFFFGVIFVAGSLRGLFQVWSDQPDIIIGMGRKKTGEESVLRFEQCCQVLEAFLTEQKTITSVSLLRGGREKTAADEALARLDEIEEAALPEEERLLYQKLCYCRKLRELGRELPDYEALLSEFNGKLQQFREAYCVFRFENKEDVKAYLEWLEQQPKAFEALAERLEAQKALPGFYSESSISQSLILCKELSSEQEVWGKGFEEALRDCGFLQEEERRELAAQKDSLVRNQVNPALRQLEEQISLMKGAEYSCGLCSYPEGAAYYDYLLECNTGSGMTAEEMYWYLDAARAKLFEPRAEKGEGRADLDLRSMDALEGLELANAVLQKLYEHTAAEYPALEQFQWNLAELPEAFYGRLSKAFYVQKEEESYLYVSEHLSEESVYSIYQILAHEGFPGHAYSYNVKRKVSYPAIDKALSFPGYSEGWAVWAELAAADWLAEGQDVYRNMVLENLYDEIVLSQMDIGIHGMGWDMQKLTDFAESVYGQAGEGIAASLWNILADNPGLYEAYTVGYLKLAELEGYYNMQGAGRQEFVEQYQLLGQTPFCLIEERIRKEELR